MPFYPDGLWLFEKFTQDNFTQTPLPGHQARDFWPILLINSSLTSQIKNISRQLNSCFLSQHLPLPFQVWWIYDKRMECRALKAKKKKSFRPKHILHIFQEVPGVDYTQSGLLENHEHEKYPQGFSKSYCQQSTLHLSDSVSAHEMEHLQKLPESM